MATTNRRAVLTAALAAAASQTPLAAAALVPTPILPALTAAGQVVDLAAYGDYELTLRLDVELDRTGVSLPAAQVGQKYVLMAGCQDGVWRLAVHERVSDDVMTELGPALVELHDQREGPDPLTLLRALLSGQTA